jgi:hypothetical protein
MGYTHYWERPKILPHLQFAAAAADCRSLCIAMDIPLGGADGKAAPVFTSAEICFNGHVDSGRLTPVQKEEGSAALHQDAQSSAVVGEVHAAVENWRAGLDLRARKLGPKGDGSYEAFRVQRVWRPRHALQQPPEEWWSDFCKTNYLPYDLCVQGCLIVLSHHLSVDHFRVSSDGTSRDWNDARDACQQILGYGSNWGEGNLTPTAPPVA